MLAMLMDCSHTLYAITCTFSTWIVWFKNIKQCKTLAKPNESVNGQIVSAISNIFQLLSSQRIICFQWNNADKDKTIWFELFPDSEDEIEQRAPPFQFYFILLSRKLNNSFLMFINQHKFTKPSQKMKWNNVILFVRLIFIFFEFIRKACFMVRRHFLPHLVIKRRRRWRVIKKETKNKTEKMVWNWKKKSHLNGICMFEQRHSETYVLCKIPHRKTHKHLL